VTSKEHKELAFYRSFFKSINATAYVMSFDPFKIDWLYPNDHSMRLIGRDEKTIVGAKGLAPFWLPPTPDFEESIVAQIKKYKTDPDTKWGGIFRAQHTDGGHHSILYTSAALEKNKAGEVTSIACIAISLDDIFNTPKTLWEAREYISQKINGNTIKQLTPRQVEVMMMIGKGYSRNKMAEELNLSVYTIEDHKQSLFKKFKCRSVKVLAQLSRELALM